MESELENRARRVFEIIKISALGSWKPCVKLKPHLWNAVGERDAGVLTFEEKCFKWDFLHIAAMTWWAAMLARGNLAPADFKTIARCLEEQAGQWNAGVIDCISDLNSFVKRYDAQYQKMTDPDEVLKFTKGIVGTWLLWNLTDKAEFKDEPELVSMLGNIAYKSVAGCWDGIV